VALAGLESLLAREALAGRLDLETLLARLDLETLLAREALAGRLDRETLAARVGSCPR
jgi:hypothetical protein